MNEKMEQFQMHFSNMIDNCVNGMPATLTHQDIIDKATELNLPLPYYNDNDELVVNWESYE
jgi:hypothetical protein